MSQPPPPPLQPPQGGPAPTSGWADAREHPDGTTVLVLGILGIVACGILAPIAWVIGNRVRREMAAQPQIMWTNRGAVTAGWVCGIVGTALVALLILGIVLLVVLVTASGGG